MSNSDPTGSKRAKSPAGKSRSASAAAVREAAHVARQARLRQARRRRLLLRVGAPVLVVLLVIVVLVVVKTSGKTTPSAVAPATTGAAASSDAAAQAVRAAGVQAAIAAIPASTFDAVAAGTGTHPPTKVTGAALTADGKPRVLYLGAEYCPFCAAQRWAVVTALSRFGTFSGLGLTTSAAGDVYPSTPTLSFHGATYTSTYLSFTGVEETTNVLNAAGDGYLPLDTMSPADQATGDTYNPGKGIPFVDFGNRYVVNGASYDPGVLKGLTQQQIAADLADPKSAVAGTVIGTANMMSAALCAMTGNHPAAVCSSAAVAAGAKGLPA